ncbi:biotin-independent malonate decarboxylase subunit beta [Thermolongibacillus altinsuensis]|uniref:biotin-independent malonate decarboxylase subunit beta n=1 Tax=Thermolongibacillus altinsuensis TaxID=575256 RepID=UPI00242A2C29|nr:biotin-independent malonate decarboxylase subunit beta [Thermolongibacillus altinsuensis]GMB08079.1 biotin-independent malonate decarboxylase subunit beta [Thermolongibacillus altinsuensis]
MKLLKDSFVELNARNRVKAILDKGTFREIVGPFDRLESPHLAPQGIVPQSDDGVIVARGKIDGEPAVVISIEGNFQGGGIGEVSGAKIAGALELAVRDQENGTRTRPVIIFDTGGVRLQEANYGLLSIAEIGAAIVALRQYVPVVGVIPGKIGCFGGMSIAAGLCSALIMTREGRIGLNGPEVIEQEAGIEELDSSDRRLVWGTIGGEQRFATGFVNELVEDDISVIKGAIHRIFRENISNTRSSQVDVYSSFIGSIDLSQPLTPKKFRELWQQYIARKDEYSLFSMQVETDKDDEATSRGRTWLYALARAAEINRKVPSVLCADAILGGEEVRYIAVVPNRKNRFYRARHGEVGIEEGWTIAKYVREAVEADRKNKKKRAIVAIVDVPSQAYGYHEELLGLHQACAAAIDAYATARLAGHPVIALLVGNAISGAFLAHGLQANRIVALNDDHVHVHVMSKKSAARITRRTIEELEEATKKIPAMAYDVRSFATLGALHALIDGINADTPIEEDIDNVCNTLLEAIQTARSAPRDLHSRLTSDQAKKGRDASILIRKKLAEQWN